MSFLKLPRFNFTRTDIDALIADSRFRRYALTTALLWFFICLLWGAPASLMAALLKPFAPQLELHALEGSFWHGRAGEAFWQQKNQRIAFGTVEWQLSPWSLLWLHPSVHLDTHYGEQFLDARVRISPLGNLQLRDVSAALPVAALAHWLPIPADGLFGAKLPRVDLALRGMRLADVQGEVQWQRATWQWSSRWITLGDYSCRLEMKDATQLHGILQGQGALAANGDIAVNFKEQNYSVQLQLTPAVSLPQEFRDGVGLLLAAKHDEQGRWILTRNAKW